MSAPDWHVVIEGDRPEVYINAAAIARLACASPLGIHAAMANLKRAMSPEHFDLIEHELELIANA